MVADYRGEYGAVVRTSDAVHWGPARFGLVASAIAGRTVDVAPARIGEPAWTDGATVYIDPAASPESQRTAVAVQSALLGAGSLEPHLIQSLSRRPALALRYLSVEAHRALWAQRELVPKQFRDLIDVATARELGDSSDIACHCMQSSHHRSSPDCVWRHSAAPDNRH